MANPGGVGVPPPFRWLPWLAGPLAAAALFQVVDSGPPPVDAGAVGGSIELGGSGDGTAVPAGAGSLDLGGSGVAEASTAGSGSLSLGGSGVAQAVAAPAGSLSLGGSGTWTEPAAGSLDLGGAGVPVASVAAAGSLQLGGAATWTVSSAGSLLLGGSGAGSAAPIATGSLSLGGTGTGSGSAVAAGSIVLGGTGTWTTVAGGLLNLGGTGTTAGVAVAAGSLNLGGSGSPTGSGAGAGSLTLGGAGAARAGGVGSGSLSLGGTGTGTSSGSGSGTGHLTLGGAAVAVKLGVLKVNVGTALSPDWRDIGCGGIPTAAALYQFVFDVRPDTAGTDSTTCTLHWFDGTSEHLIGTYTAPGGAPGAYAWTTVTADVTAYWVAGAVNEARLRYSSGADTSHFRRMHLLADGTLVSYGQFPSGSSYTAAVQDGDTVGLASTNYELAEQGGGAAAQYDASTVSTFAFGLAFVRLYFPALAGRLKLWDGTQWVREACDTITPVITFADDFNRSNRALSGDNGWTDGVGVMQILSNVARWTSAGPSGFTTTYRPGSASSGTYAVDKGTNVNAWLMVRHDLSLGFILIRGDFAFKWDTATLSFTLLATLSGTSGAQRIGVTITGDTFAVTQDGVSVGSFTSSAYSGGAAQVGLYVSDAAATLDNFSITDVPVARPLYVWTGTAWDRVACMVPA